MPGDQGFLSGRIFVNARSFVKAYCFRCHIGIRVFEETTRDGGDTQPADAALGRGCKSGYHPRRAEPEFDREMAVSKPGRGHAPIEVEEMGLSMGDFVLAS
ncbi:MAG: hypothetical protein O3B73_15365 [bacterium]|nr:hypothetical protein [bacterium]